VNNTLFFFPTGAFSDSKDIFRHGKFWGEQLPP